MHACTSHEICTDNALQKAQLICQDKGLRFTDLRRRALEIIWATHRPTKAYDMLDGLRKGDAPAKPPTVYRTLDFLLENGLVHKLNSLNAYIGCSHPLKHSECYFLICDTCGESMECCNDNFEKAVSSVASKSKFKLKHVTLEIEGECGECTGKR